MSANVIFVERAGWNHQARDNLEIFATGDSAAIDTFVARLDQTHLNAKAVTAAAAAARGHYAAIIKGPNFCCAVTDHCRSSPIFFANSMVSNDAHVLRLKAGLDTPDLKGIRDAAMAGFVTGRNTLFHGLSQLETGAFALWLSNDSTPLLGRHTVYRPDSVSHQSSISLIDDFLAILDETILRVISLAAGRPIWVALSGGLDSRLLLAKLVEHKCDNLFAFSYGPSGNDDALAARTIAKRLGVNWQFYPHTRRDMRNFFSSAERRAYWAFSDGLSAVPNFQDFLALKKLKEQGSLPRNAIIINGQTGDFISGGHIPAALMIKNPTANDLFDSVLSKHFSLWESLKTPERLEELRSEVLGRLGIHSGATLDRDEAVAHFERFEYEERQAKYVINGQRNYEFLGRDWALPLWDTDIIRFWQNVSVDLKYRQALYRASLARWDFQGLFRDFQPTVSHWPGPMKAILVPSRLIRLAFGTEIRDAFLKRMLYFGMYQDQYAPFGYLEFLRQAADFRNPVSLLSKTWLSELGLPTLAN